MQLYFTGISPWLTWAVGVFWVTPASLVLFLTFLCSACYTIPPCFMQLVLGWKYRQAGHLGKYVIAFSQHVSAVK